MDHQLFRIDFAVLAEVLAVVILLAFFIERALALVFEHRLFVTYLDRRGIKEPIAFGVSYAVVQYWHFDAISVLLQGEAITFWGMVITPAIVAGGSKASVKLFHDYLQAMSQAKKQQLGLQGAPRS